MFQYECLQAKGTPVGYCVNSWLVGSCCKLPPSQHKPQLETVETIPSTTSSTSTTSTHRPLSQSINISTTTDQVWSETSSEATTTEPHSSSTRSTTHESTTLVANNDYSELNSNKSVSNEWATSGAPVDHQSISLSTTLSPIQTSTPIIVTTEEITTTVVKDNKTQIQSMPSTTTIESDGKYNTTEAIGTINERDPLHKTQTNSSESTTQTTTLSIAGVNH